MKIAITNAFLPSEQQSGVPFQVHYLANALHGSGHEVTVFSFSPLPTDATYALHRFPRPKTAPRYFPFFMAYRLATTDFSGFDVVNVHGDNYLLRTSTPVVRTFHGSALDEFRHAETLRRKLFFLVTVPLERLGARLADAVVGVSATTKIGVPEVQTIIPCGVDTTLFHQGVKSVGPTVLFVGTEHGRKRGAWLAELFSSQIRPVVPEAELHIVSECAPTVENGVRRFGRVSSEALVDLYRSAWVFCLPSSYEGFGVPYIEAMASNTAVVATSPNPGAEEVLESGRYGAFVEDSDLARTIIDLLTDGAMRAERERKGLERSRDFAWTTVAQRYIDVFRKVAARRFPPR